MSHSLGSLSSRQRRNFAPCRIRCPVMWSNATSHTSSGRRPSQTSSSSLFQRLGSPEPRSCGAVGLEQVQQLALLLGAEAGGVPDDVQLAVLVVHPEDQRADGALLLAEAEGGDHAVGRADALDLDHALALARAGTARRPPWRSRPPRCRSATCRRASRVARSPGSAAPARRRPPRAARGAPRRAARAASSSPSASRSKATNAAGVSRASFSTREAAGWMRWESRSNSWTPSTITTISPSSTSSLGAHRRHLLHDLGEVAVHRAPVAALEVHLFAVPEDDRAEAVPLGLVAPIVALGELFGGLRQLRLDRRLEGQGHWARIVG